jgi:hypothetical protein
VKSAVLTLAVLIVFAASAAGAAIIPISEAKEINQSGIPVNIGQIVTVSGVVTVANRTFSTTDFDVHIQDATAGINVFLRNGGYYKLSLGDSVVATGIIDQEGRTPRRNNTKLTLLSIDDVEIVGKPGPVAPLVVTAADLDETAEPPLEFYEGRLVRLEGMSIDPGEWPAAGSDKFITAVDATGSVSVRLDKDTDIPGSEPPGSPFILIGVVIQDSNNPFTGYKVWPRSRYSDFLETGNGSGIAEVEPSVVQTDAGQLDLHVTLKGNGVDVITSFEVALPLDEGWNWEASADKVSLAGAGLAGAEFEVTPAGAVIRSAAVLDEASSGTVTFSGVTPPASVGTSEIDISTSVDGETYEAIARNPSVTVLLPLPDVVVNEVFPDDGASAQSDAFVELRNRGSSTARLEGLILSDLRTVPYCDPVSRVTFGAADTIPAGGYFVIAENEAGFNERFGAAPDLTAGISPLGRVDGDGALSGNIKGYEDVALWRGAVDGELIDHCEYKDPLVFKSDLCEALGGDQDAYPLIPPAGYALARYESAADQDASDKDFALSSEPTPGAENVTADHAPPELLSVVPHSQDVIEVFFNEPCDSSYLGDLSAYEINGERPLAAYTSSSLEKVALLFEGFGLGINTTLEVARMRDRSGNTAEDLSLDFKTSSVLATSICTVQEYDEKGYSPLLGEYVTVIGFITVAQGTFQPQYNSIYIQGLDGCGVNVFSYDPPSPNPRLGDLVRVYGQVDEYASETAGATTELYMSSPLSEVLLSSYYPEPRGAEMKTGEIGIEENEGKLIRTEGSVISAGDYGFYLDDGSGGIQVYQNYTPIDYSKYKVGMYIRVQGVLLQYDRTLPFFEGYELVPRRESDIVVVENAYPGEAVLEVEPRVFCPSCGDEGFVVKFGTPSEAQVTLRIFDGKGRLVTTLFSGMSVGKSEKMWDGRSESGEPVPPGLYVCFLDSIEARTGKKTTDSAPIVVGVELK